MMFSHLMMILYLNREIHLIIQKLSLILLASCPDGFVEHEGNCYKVSSDRLSWHEARFECLSLEGNYDLAIIDNLDLFKFMKKYTHHWIGLYSRVGKRDFKWVDGTIVEFGKTWKQKPWDKSEPSVRCLVELLLISNLTANFK